MNPPPDFLLPLRSFSYPFPQEAVAAALQRCEESVPYLLYSLEWADAHAAEVDEWDTEDSLYIYALYVLAQLRETRAYPLVVRLFANPLYEELTGDVATESLHQILASVCGGDLGPIKSLVEDGKVSEWVRGAALRALKVLVHCGRLSREELSVYFGELFAGKQDREPNHVWDTAISMCSDLRLSEHLESIRRLYHQGVADPMFNTLKSVEREIFRPPGLTRFDGPAREDGLIESAVDELKVWSCFRPPSPLEEESVESETAESQARMAALAREYPMPTVTYTRESPKVGRNESCPCGSGRKFKKCCGASA